MRAVAEGIGERQRGRGRDREGREVVGAEHGQPELAADHLGRDDAGDGRERDAAPDAAEKIERIERPAHGTHAGARRGQGGSIMFAASVRKVVGAPKGPQDHATAAR